MIMGKSGLHVSLHLMEVVVFLQVLDHLTHRRFSCWALGRRRALSGAIHIHIHAHTWLLLSGDGRFSCMRLDCVHVSIYMSCSCPSRLFFASSATGRCGLGKWPESAELLLRTRRIEPCFQQTWLQAAWRSHAASFKVCRYIHI